ncbi:MAG: M3 family metallopeptidase, partial [Gammaproteobacteria bacterium]|nr:M3 family metallopeptidase [Gammaproteobacteria bacterium]
MTNPLLDTSSLPRFADISPDHVIPALTEIIATHRQRLDALLSTSDEPDFDSFVVPVEDMEHELSRVWSPVSHLQSVLGSNEWRDAYNKALPILTEYGTELSQNTDLQHAYAAVEGKLSRDADVSRRSAVEHALREFRLAGVDLDDEKKSRFREIMRELAETQANFDHNVQDASDAWLLSIEDERELAGLPDSLLSRAEAEATRRGYTDTARTWLLTLDFPTYDAVMKHAENRSLRENFYHAWSTRGSDEGANPDWDNSDNIQKILALRHEAANLVGFDSYADYSLATKMAGSSDEVLGFLHELGQRTLPAARRELDEVRKFAGMAIEPWDLTFFLEKLKQERYSISNEELRQYFPTNTVIHGLFDLAGKLYGVSLDQKDDVETWHSDARYFEIHDPDGELIGGFYADFYARGGKRSGAWIDDCINRKNLNGQATLPVGYLVCNFSPPEAGKDSLLTHNDIVTLFHEFGHMLHHLLTRIDIPSVAGINGVPWDAVELPSQFMENFAWNFEVLQRCSSHAESGEQLPRDLFDRLDDSRHVGVALATQRQLEFALFDFRLHNEYDPATPVDPVALLNEVRDEMSLLRHPDYNRMPHAFSHIFAGGYAAGYYSYKWAEVLAADAFAA